MDDQNRRALFTNVGYRDKLPDRLLALAWVPETICQNLCIDSVHPINTEDSLLQHRLFNSLLLHLARILMIVS